MTQKLPTSDPPRDLVALSHRAADLWGDRTLLTFHPVGGRLSFADLRRRTDRIAAWLLAAGIRAGDRVALLTGANLVVVDRFHPAGFWDTVREHRVTWFYCLGVMPRLLLKTPPTARDREHAVRFVACSAIPVNDHAKIEARWGVPWFEHFGMTETGMDISVPVARHDDLVGSGCIGAALPTREARIVDEQDRVLPRGVDGELVLRGPGMMDGYYRDPQASARTLRGGWMHTGDIARMDGQGLVYYVGRTRDMIRRSGENIAAAEVEAVIAQHCGVQLAACLAVPDEVRGEEIKAYVVRQHGEDDRCNTTPEELVAFCRERIAYFKVPRYWCFRDDLPRTPSEKVIKSALLDKCDPLADAYDAVENRWL